MLANAINIREIGWFLDEELLAGKLFVPSATNTTGTQGQFRTVLRYVLNISPIVTGSHTYTVPVLFDANFTLVDCWVSGTNTGTLTAQVITDDDVVLTSTGTVTTLTVNSPGDFDIGWFILEYMQEP